MAYGNDSPRTGTIISVTTLAIIILTGLVVLGMWGCPQYNVYQMRKDGEAQLAHAQSAKEVAVSEAKAKMESAQYEAQADTIRAHGIAKSNEIIGSSLRQNEDYLKWLWIDNLQKQQSVIYVPTEGNIPIMEAGKHPQPPPAAK